MSLLALGLLFAGDARGQQPPISSAPPASAAPAQPFIIQQLITRFHLESDGSGTRDASIVVRIESDLGIRRWGQLAFVYTPESQAFTVSSLEVRKIDGSVVRPASDAIADSAVQPGAGINMLQDLRQVLITVPSLGVGDSLALNVRWKTHTPVVTGQFWIEHTFTKDAVVLDEQLDVDMPEGLAPVIRVAPDAPAETTGLKGTVVNGRRLLRWKRVNLELPKDQTPEAVDDDEGAPPADVRMSSFPNWESIVAWYDGLASRALVTDDRVRAKALELTKGATTADERIQSLYDFVSKDIRYVSLSFGLGRYAPHPAPEVLTNQYGDCKDKHTLLAAMLKVVGIDARPVLANVARRIDPDMPSPAEFNHLFTVVPRGASMADWLWLDTTPGVAPIGMLVPQLRGRDVLVVAPRIQGRAAAIARTPADPPFTASTVVEIAGRIDTVGSLSAQIRYTLRSDEELTLRAILMNIPPDKMNDIGKGVSTAMGFGDDTRDFKVVNLESTRQPLRLEFTVRKPGLFKWTKDGATLTLPLQPMTFPNGTAAEWKDRTRARLGPPASWTLKASLELPAGYRPTLPVGIDLPRDGFAFSSTYRFESGRVLAERTFRTTHDEVPAGSAPEYIAFVRAVRTDEQQTVGLTFDTAGTPEIPPDAAPDELYAAGLAAYDATRYEIAIAYWEAVAKLAPKHDSAWDAIGLANEKLHRPDRAIEALRTQTTVSPFHKQAFKDLARVLHAQHLDEEARAALGKHVDNAPLDGDALDDLGSWLLDVNRDAEALPYLERAAALKKTSAFTHGRLGAAYARIKQAAKARASFERAIAISPAPGIWTFAAWELSTNGLELPWAEELARKTLASVGEHMKTIDVNRVTKDDWYLVERVGWSWDALGWLLSQRGDTQAAERYTMAAWMLVGEAEMISHLARIYEKQNRLSDAGSAYVTALAFGDASSDTSERARRLLGVKAEELSDLFDGARKTVALQRSAFLTAGDPLASMVRMTGMVMADGTIGTLQQGPDVAPEALAAVRRATLPLKFPDDAIGQLPAELAVECHQAPAQCVVAFAPAGATRR